MVAAWVEDLVLPGRRLRDAGNGLLSVMEPEDRGARYDGRAAAYDRLVGNGLYNRLVWGSSPSSYTAFAAEALAEGDGALLDVGCGSAVFTAPAYHRADRPLVLVDRSVDMLNRAKHRLGRLQNDGDRIVLVQADLFDLPFVPRSFGTVACFGLLHLFDDVAGTLGALRAQLAAGGSLYATSLVAETAVGRRALALLHRAGEAAAPRRRSDLAMSAHAVLGRAIHMRHQGSMAFLTATTPNGTADRLPLDDRLPDEPA